LCKRQWRNQSADQSNDCSFHSDASFLICLRPQFVIQASSGRLARNLFIRLVLRRFGVFADFIDLSGRREFGNMGRQ
jgi:hypothetical protein